MMIEIKEALSLSDVMLVPQYSDITSRSQIDLSVKMRRLKFDHPIIPANMLTITGKEMAKANCQAGGLSILNRFLSLEEQIEIAKDMMNDFQDRFAVSVGVKKEDHENLQTFREIGVKIVCIDIAHGDSQHCIEMTQHIRKTHPHMFIIAGNVSTGEGAKRLWKAGADAVKTGVGNGSLCSTRIMTGNGVAQFSALLNVKQAQQEIRRARYGDYKSGGYYIIADGGCKSSGDLVKSLCFSDLVMAGNLFAGCEECDGEIVKVNGIRHKKYVGSSTHKTSHIEGVSSLVECKGKYVDVLTKLLDGIRSGCSYQGVHNLLELKENPEFVRITHAGLIESHPHIQGVEIK